MSDRATTRWTVTQRACARIWSCSITRAGPGPAAPDARRRVDLRRRHRRRRAGRPRRGVRARARARVSNLLVVDENPLDRAGPWLNFARMRTLRTPKYLTGPDLGIPSLTPRAWYEAQHGAGSWEALGLIPKETWAGVPGVVPAHARHPGAARHARRARCAGTRASAPWEVPCTDAAPAAPAETLLRAARGAGDRHRRLGPLGGARRWSATRLPRARCTRTPAGRSTSRRCAGKRVAVLGAGASAFDNAATALEHGAREVALCFRRASAGQRERLPLGRVRRLPAPPRRPARRRQVALHPPDRAHGPAAARATPTAARAQHAGLPPARRAAAGRALELRGDDDHDRDDTTASHARGRLRHRRHRASSTDLALRPELRAVEPHIARWADRYHAARRASASEDLAAPPLPRPRLRVHRAHAGRGAVSALPLQLHVRRPARAWASAAPASRA